MPRVSDAYGQRQRERIIEAAAACFSERGYHQTSVQEICDAARLSKGGLYTYFPSKDELLAAVVQESFLGMLAEAQAAAAGAGTAVEKFERVAAMVESRLTSGRPSPVHSPQLQLEIWAEASKNSRLRELCSQSYARWTAFIAGLLRQGIGQGLIRSDVDPEAIAAILIGAFDGLSLQESITRTQPDWGRVMATLRSAIGEGIFSAEARGGRS